MRRLFSPQGHPTKVQYPVRNATGLLRGSRLRNCETVDTGRHCKENRRQATPPGLIREDLIAAERPASAARGVALGRLFDALPQLPGQRGLEGRRARRERGSGAPEGHGRIKRLDSERWPVRSSTRSYL